MKKIAVLAFTVLFSGTALMAQDTSLNRPNNPTNPTYDTTSLPNSNNSWNRDKDKSNNNWNKDKMKHKRKNNQPDSSAANRPDSLRREN